MIDTLLRQGQRGALGCAVGPGDDAAVLPDGTAISTDTLVEGVHWDDRLGPNDVGFKAVAVSVSDVCSMGARPQWLLLNVSLPRPLDRQWVQELARGVGQACERWGVELIGGDTTHSAVRVVTTTVGGPCAAAPMVRSGALPGHDVWVTGHLGAAGLGYLERGAPAQALHALRRPSPPVAFALDLAQRGLASAAIDLSDGLAIDAAHMARASAVALRLRGADIPLSPCLDGHPRALHLALTGGEDYQLLFAAPREHRASIEALGGQQGVPLSVIGHVEAGAGLTIDDAQAPRTSFSHFEAAP